MERLIIPKNEIAGGLTGLAIARIFQLPPEIALVLTGYGSMVGFWLGHDDSKPFENSTT